MSVASPQLILASSSPRRAELHLYDDGHRLVDSIDAIGRLFGDLLDRAAG